MNPFWAAIYLACEERKNQILLERRDRRNRNKFALLGLGLVALCALFYVLGRQGGLTNYP